MKFYDYIMLNMRLFFCILFLMAITPNLLAAGNDDFEKQVREAVRNQMKKYPESTLKDIYKNFFQDRFGPGHLIQDTAAAGRYLRREMDAYQEITGETAEPAGWQHNFYRVNLSAVKNGLIPAKLLLDALIRSANEAEKVSMDEWEKEWSRIEAVIRSMDLSLPDYEADLEEINKKLQEGIYVGHHSKAYNEAYAPHYRIISRKIYEEELLPLLK